jgi:DNA invertase Pin-like site-specific DNA recombinase
MKTRDGAASASRGAPVFSECLKTPWGPAAGSTRFLVYDISRWGRFQDVDESAHYEFLCRKAGIKILYCAEPFENDGTPMAAVMKAIKRTMAAEYSRELSEKVRRGKLRLAAAGFSQTKPGYGLRRLLVDENGVPRGLLEPHQRKAVQSDRVRVVAGLPKEIAVVRKIFRLFAYLGMGYTDIANHLNDRAIPNAAGERWSPESVRTVLTNEAYIGNLVYGRRTCRLKTIVRNPPETWVRYENALPPIVPFRLFERVRRRMFQIKRSRTDDYFLRPLKALYQREGYLTEVMMEAEPGMPKPDAYKWRFGGLTNAYRLVGYDSPYRHFRSWSRAKMKEPDREGMLAQLSSLLDRTGYLTAKLIDTEPGMPSFRQYQWAFGDLATAYRLIQYVPQKTGPRQPRARTSALSPLGTSTRP